MAGKLKDLYVKRNQNQYQPAADSWEARAAELSNMSGGAMQQGETAGNGALGWLKDSADAGFFNTLGGTARLAGEFMPFGNDTLNSWADYFDDVARRNSPQPGQNLEGIDYVASAVGNALGSGGASALEAGVVAGIGSLLGVGGAAGAVLGGASKVIPGVGKAVQAGKTLWGSPVGKYLVANVAGSPFEAGSEAGNLISDMRRENQQGTANYTDDEIRDAALRSGALNLAWLTGMNMLEAGTLGKITGALGGKMAKDTYKGIAGRALMGGTASGIGEGAEEYGQNLIGDYSKRGSTADFNYDEAMEAAKMGAIGGGVLGGLGSGLSAKFSKKNSDVSEEIASEDGGTIEEAPEATVSGREAFINAIAGQESGGSYNAENSDTGAYGKYQILPSNWPEWAEEAGIGADAPRTPENQEIVARFKLGQYYDKYGARGAAIAWYGGEGALNYSEEALNRKQGDNGEYPSINEYADEVLGRMGNVADSVRIDDTEENYFDESNYTDDAILGALRPARGFDVSHLENGEAQDRNSVAQFEKLSPEVEAQRKEFTRQQEIENRRKQSNALMEELRAAGNNPQRTARYGFEQRKVSPADALAHGFGKIETIPNIDTQKAFNNNIQTNIMRKRSKTSNGLRPNVQFDEEQTIPGSLYNFANSPRDMANVTNFKLKNDNAATDRSGMQWELPQQQTQNAAQEEAKRQAAIRAIAEQQKIAYEQEIGAVRPGQATFRPNVSYNYDYQSAFVPNARRALALQNNIRQQEQPSIEPTPRNGRALDERNFREVTLPKVREQHKWDKERKEYHAERYGESALPQTQLLSTDRAARRNMPKPGIEARSFINDRAEKKSARERMQDAIAFVWKDDPKHPLKSCRRQLNMFRDMRKEYLQPIYDVMAEGAGNGVSRIPIIEFDNQHRGRFYRQSNNSPWYAKYFKEHKKKPTQKAMYDIAEEVAFGENADVGYYAGVQGKELEAIVAENHEQLDPINDYIQTYESLELRLKENPNYGKEQAERINKAEEERRAEKRNAGETASAESIQAEAKQPAESNQDEVKETAEPQEKPEPRDLLFTVKSNGKEEDNVIVVDIMKSKEPKYQQTIKKMLEAGWKKAETNTIPNVALDQYYAPATEENYNFAKGLTNKAVGYNLMGGQPGGWDYMQGLLDHEAEERRKSERTLGEVLEDEGITADITVDDNQSITIEFSKKPSDEVRQSVKEAGYKWRDGAWKSKVNERSMEIAKELGYKPAEKAETEQGEKLNLPKGTTADVSIVGDNSNIIQVKFNGAQGKGTGGIMGRAGYKWKSDKQVWQARKTEKAMDVAEQLGYTEEAKPQERDYELERDELWDTFATKLGIDNILSVDKANEELKGVEGLHDGAIVYFNKDNRNYSIISFEDDAKMLELGYKYHVYEYGVNLVGTRVGSQKTVDEVIDYVKDKDTTETSTPTKAKARADIFSKNPDALFNDKIMKDIASGLTPKQVTDIIQKMPKAEQSKTAKKQTQETKPAEKQEVKEPATRFDGERARKSLDALIGRKKKSEPQKNDVVPKSKFMNVFNEDELDAEIEKAKKEMSKLSANPMFNPALMKSLFKIGGIYLQKGVNKFAAWADNMVDVMGEKVRPFLPAVWDSLKKYPDNQKFNDDVMTAVMEYVGEGVDNGKSLSTIKREFADDYGDEYLGYVDAAFEGVKKYPTSDNVADVVESKQDNTEGGKENGTDGQTIQTGDSSGSGAVRRGVSSTGKAVHAGGRRSERSDSLLGREPSEDGGTSEETGNSSRVRDSEHNQSGRPTGKESEFGNVHNGRKGERSSEQTDVAGSVGRRSRGTDGGRTGVTTNYHIEDADALIGGTPKVRFLRNKKAIEVVQELLDNERPATKEERDAMAAYIGWGSFGQELFQGTWEKPIYKDGWKEENDWLRDTLGKDAWEEAQNSIINAHYTDPYTINSMWEMAKNMGFKGGKVLEPSMGVGNFFGLMPKGIAEKSQLTGIELDRTTGRMAQALYPQANIQIKGYEESRTPDNFYDMIIGNVPFGNFNIADRRYGKLKPLIHDFFFLKGIDQLKPGGIMMAITTKGTLDKADARVRMELAKKADLVAAYRLPTGAFDKYAGTNVVTDILIFKKLDKPRTGVRELEWVNSSKYQTTFRGQQETYYYNDYFKNHPENVLGIMEFGHGTTTGRPGLTVKRLDDFGERLKEIPNEVPKNIFEADKAQDNIQYISNHKGGEQGSVTVENGKLYTVYGDQLKPLADTKKYSVKSDKQTAQRIQEINDWIKLRDTLGALYDAERTDAANMEELRVELNKVFDDYCAKYVKQGKWERKDKDEQPPFRQSYVNKYMKAIEEPSAARVMALVDDNGNKTAIFSKRSVRGSNTDIKNPTISQALIMQRNENVSNLDIDRIAELAKKSNADVISELTKSGTIFKTPAGNYEVKDVYLSGNVRQKLREAEDALQSGDKDMQANIEALKKVIPETVPYYNISTSMGATWIPQDVYRQFIAHLLSVDSIDNIKLTRTKGYSVELGKGYNNLNAATTVYGLSEIPFSKLLTHAFNHTKPVITMRKSGEVVEDTEAMNKANDKLEKIYDEFNDWLWKDNSRKLQLEHEYNEIMNAIAVPTYDGSFMDMPGMALLRGNSQFNLRQHQLNAIYRGLINGSGVYAHEVGTGKTYTMAGLAIESRRYGLAKKPLLLAFNANSASVAKEINDMYPGAKVLYIDNLDRKNIKLKLEQIRTDDWDCVVMPHSLVDKLSFKEDTLMAMAEQQIYELEQAAIEAAEQDGEKISVEQMEKMRTAGKDEKVKGVRSTTAKKLVTMRNKIINQIKQSALNASAVDAISFEDLGIDMVLVDEAHAFKKPPFATTRKIKGLTTESSNRSIQLSFITQYIQSINNGRGVHLFTGTPITNTLTEMYHMMRYVMPKAMEDAGIKEFDSWMNSFAEETADMEFTSTGDVEMVSRLASFTNVPELRRFVGQYWDTVFADDMPEFKPRETASGKTITDKLTDKEQDELLNGYTEEPQGRPYKKVIVETLKLTNSQNTILNDLVKKAKRYKDATKQERKKIARQEFHATPLLISNDASLAGMDPRLYDININTQGEETKIDRCVSNVAKIYKEGTDAHPTVQVIFTDVGYSDTKTRSIPQRTGFGEGDFKSVKETVPTFNMAKALVKQLTEQGIPENEIVVMKASYSPEKRAQIADMLKTGKYRVVIGSTATLGVGVNMQDNLRAMHHLDCPWMPGDLTQRNGRGHRQGNHWNTVLEYRYVTEKLDTKRWQTVLRKDAFINSFMKSKVGDNSVRAFEMGADDMNDKDTDSDLLQTLSEASGDPRVLIQKKYETNLAKLERKERTFIAGIEDIKGRLKYIDSVIEHKKDEWKALSADAETFVANKKADFEIKLVSSLKVGASRKLVTFDNRTDAQKHLGDILKQVMDIGVDNRIGEYTGFEVVVRKEASSIDGTYQPVIRLNGATTHLCGTPSIGGIASKAANIPGRVGKAQAAYEQAKKDKTELQKAAQETFPQQEQLDKTRKQLEEVKQDRMLSPTPPPEWLVNGVTLSSTFYVDDKPYSLSGYRANSDGYYLVGEANGEQRVFPFQDATDIQGMKVYDMTNHVPSPAYKAPSAEDIKNATANNTQYSVSSEAVQRAKEEVEAEIKKALPGAEFEQRADGSYIATMPNGKRLGIVIEDQILLNERQAEKAGKAHNRAVSEAEGYWSRWEQLDGKNIDGVIRVSRNSRVGTAFHETLHAAMDLCLTDKEKAALYKAFAKKAKESGRSVDEEIADAYKEWAIKRQSGQGSMFGKLFQKAKDFLNKLYTMFVEADNKGNIFRKLESGEAWKQQTYNASEAPKFNITSADIKKFINTALKNPAKHLRMVLGKVSNAEAEAIKKATGMDVQNFTHVWFSEDVRHIKNRHGVGNEKDKRQIGLTQEDIEKAIDVIKSPDRIEKGTTDNGRESIRFMKANSNGEYTVVEVVSNDKKQLAIKTMWNKKEAATTKRHADEISPQYTSETGSGNTASVSDTVSSNSQEVKYSVAPAKHKIANAFTNTERKGVVDSAKDFFKEHRKSLYQDWFDKNNPLKGFDALTKATGGLSVYDQVQSLPATTAGMLKALTEGTAQHVKMANQHLKNVKMKYNVTLAMALEKIDKKQMDKAYPKYLAENGFDNWVNALGAYLGAERCLEMARLARAEGKTYKFPKGLTEQECQDFVNKAPQQFKAAADIFYKVNDNVISIMEDAEVFSHDLAKTLRTKYRKYCPLLRDFSDTAAADSFIGGLTEGGRGIGNVSVPLKRINIEGSERGVLNPLETILKSYAVMLNRAERNKVALMAVENSRTADLHELIQEVPGTTADPKNCVFTVLINGKKKAYKTTQDLYGPIVGYNLPAANLAFGVARTAARMLRTGATMSPSFILRNVLRDTVFAGIASKNGFIPIVDTVRGAIALAKDPAMRAEFEAAGVTEYNFYSSQKSRIKSLDAMAGETPASAWEIMKAVFSRLEATSDFFESSTRMGEYMKARQKGLSMEEAARAAREVTLDFSRSGRVGEQVNQVVPFFNACLQGGDKMVRLFREDFVGTSLKVLKYIVLPSLLIMAMNWDEDWYKDLDPDIKNNYWCLGRNIRIPKPQEAGVLFGSGIEALFQQAADKDKDAVSNFLKAFSSNMMPSVLPTLILPLIEWSANYSFFKGRPLVGNKYSRLPDELQYNDYTSELSKGIGSALKVSPMKIDNLVRGYTGTMGALLWSMAGEPFAKANNLPAKHFSELPFVRDFNVTDANLSRPMNEFYGILDKANRQHAGYGVKGKPEAAVKGIRSAGAMISKIRKDIDKITHGNLTPERKRELIDKRKEKMNQIAKQATARYGKYFE